MCDSTGANCQTIDDILLDAGDDGLRVFQQALNGPVLTALSQNPVQVNGQSLYDCLEYVDGSAVWGPVAYATINTDPPVQVPIHVIGSTAGNPSHVCAGALSSPDVAYYNGSLGIGIFAQDCGSACVSGPVGQYFTCSGSTCTGTAVPLASQVQNPVASLPTDNNGVLVSLPFVSPTGTGAPSITGSLIFGIGTQANNTPSPTVTAYGVDSSTGYFTTTFNGKPYNGFLDTGSNGLFVSYAGQPSSDNGFYTANVSNLMATNTGASNAPNSGEVTFDIANADTLFASPNNVFSNLAGPLPGGLFDWGLPFFLLEQKVYIGIEGRSSQLNSGPVTGPFWAF
jgi:hypothetical protein